MSSLVIDASVAVKWFLPERDNEAALALLDSGKTLHAPDFILLEIDNVLWKNVIRNKITKEIANKIHSSFGKYEISKIPLTELVDLAWELSLETGCTVYDCLYLALAVRLYCPLATADIRFYNVVLTTACKNHILLIKDPES